MLKSHVTNIYDVSAERKTGNNLLELMIREKSFIEDTLGIKLIGWTLDAGSDAKNAWKELIHHFPHLLHTNCIAHQVCRP